jgi:hypothetical protein
MQLHKDYRSILHSRMSLRSPPCWAATDSHDVTLLAKCQHSGQKRRYSTILITEFFYFVIKEFLTLIWAVRKTWQRHCQLIFFAADNVDPELDSEAGSDAIAEESHTKNDDGKMWSADINVANWVTLLSLTVSPFQEAMDYATSKQRGRQLRNDSVRGPVGWLIGDFITANETGYLRRTCCVQPCCFV